MRPSEPDFSSLATPGATERFERVWATTRPAEPSAELLDALWARASAELDRIDATGLPGLDEPVIALRRRRSQRRIIAGIMLAQAAAVLVAVGLAWTHVPTTPMLAAKPMVVVGTEQTLVIRIDDDGHRVDFLDQPPMFPKMAENTPHDFFDALEIAATP